MKRNPFLSPRPEGFRRALLIVLLAFLGTSLSSARLTATGPLYPQTWFPTDSDARVYMGRFDADSAVDLVSSLEGAIVVRHNDGHAVFTRLSATNIEPGVYAAAVGDFTGDGLEDVLISNSEGGVTATLSVLPGNGDGSFGARMGATPYTGHAGFVVVDLNADGRDDLVSANLATFDGIIVFLSRGDGSFSTEAIPTGGFVGDLGTGDFNGDGARDIVLVLSSASTGSQTTVAVLFNPGGGTGFVRSQFVVPGQTVGIPVGDLNADGRSDLAAIVRYPAPGLLVYLGQTDGSFAPGGGAGPEAGLVAPTEPAVARLGGSGGGDVVLNDGYDLVTLLNNGDGTFRPVRRRLGLFGGKTFADLDGDGRTDMLLGAILFLGHGDGTFAQQIVSPAEDCLRAFATADFDGDGRLDVASSWSCGSEIPSSFGAGVQIHVGRGDGSFAAPRPAIDLGSGDANALATGDFDGDGRADVAVVSFGKDDLLVALGTGLGSFGSEAHYPTGAGPFAVVAGDFDRDGRDDLAVADATASAVSILLARDGGFAGPVDYPVGGGPAAIAIGDFDGDGHADLVTADHRSDTVSILSGHGDGTFAAAVARPVPGGPWAIAAGDLDRDGRDDIAVVTGQDRDSVTIFLSDGGITFRPFVQTQHFSVAIADVEGDGALDVIADGWVLPGDIRGGFRPPVDYAAGFGQLVVGQFDGVSGLDLLTLGGAGLAVLPSQIRSVDQDDDGIPDAIDNCPALYNPDQADGDLDGVGDLCDNCPSAYNPVQIDQNANGIGDVCDPALPFVAGLTISNDSPIGRGSRTLRWSTNWEVKLLGFNVVVYDERGRRNQINPVLIPCSECVTELGASYVFLVPKHRSGRNVFLEAVFINGTTITGPAAKE